VARTWPALARDLTPARLAQMRNALANDIAAAAELAAGPALERAQQIDFDTAVELLQRFAGNLADFAALYHGLTQQKRQQVSDPGAYSPKTPPAIIVASGVRAGATLLITGRHVVLAGLAGHRQRHPDGDHLLRAGLLLAAPDGAGAAGADRLPDRHAAGLHHRIPAGGQGRQLLRWCWPRCRCSLAPT
jgi:hypothetical protein